MKRKGMLKGLILGAAITISGGLGCLFSSSANALEPSVELGKELQASYVVGQTVEIPSATCSVGGNAYAMESVVYTPSGFGYKTDDVLLEEVGNYTVVYMVTVDGRLYQEERSFSVAKNTFYTDGNKSEIRKDDDVADALGQSHSGIFVKLGKNERFYASEAVSISENASNEDGLISLTLLPNKLGSSDAQTLYVAFEDAYDSENVMLFKLKLNEGSQQYTYAEAKAPNRQWLGLQRWKNGNPEPYPWYNSVYGCPFAMNGGGSFNGKGYPTTITLHYDPNVNGIYMNSDKDTVAEFGTNYFASDPWSGFSSDYVKISVYATDYKEDTLNFIVTKLGDNKLETETFVDDEGPTIRIDNRNLDVNAMPEAIVGLPYDVMSATAEDLYSGTGLRVSKRVLYGYERTTGAYTTPSENFKHEYDVYGDSFEPRKTGVYSIVYSAYDYSGNYTEYVVNVNAVERKDFVSELYLTLSDFVATAEVGNKVCLPAVESYGGAKGNETLGYTVKFGEEEIALKGNAFDGYSFVPKQTGEYEMEIYVKDSNGDKKTERRTLVATAATKNGFGEEADLKKYYVAGEAYLLPTLYATDKTTGEKVAATVSYTDGDGTHEYTGAPVSFVPNKDGKATITYRSGGNEKSYVVPVVDVKDNPNGLHLTEYFQGENLETTLRSDGVCLQTLENGASAEFIKSVSANSLSLSMKIDENLNRFDALHITLTDSADKTQKIKLTVVRSTKDGYALVNGKKSSAMISDVFYNGQSFKLTYEGKSNRISFGVGDGATVNEYLSGESFKGFSSGEVYVGFELENVTSKSGVCVSQINSQRLNSNVTTDSIKPDLTINGKYSDLVVEVGTEVTVYSAQAFDVLSEIVTKTVSVMQNKTNPVVANGLLLQNLSFDREYTFVAKEEGEYTIVYAAYDSAGKMASYSYKITVRNMRPPVISLTVKTIAMKVGETLQIPTATAQDHQGNSLETYAYLIRPDYSVRALKGISGIRLNETGTYRIRYKTTDKDGNSAYAEIVVTVEEA